MRVLVLGGTGLLGAYMARDLAARGHAVTIAARHPPADRDLAALPFLQGSYIDDAFSEDQLSSFDALICAAAADFRQTPAGEDPDEFLRRANSEAIPRFFARAKRAGVKRAVYIGSFYAQVRPDLVGERGYIRSRVDADEGVRALASPDFHVVTLDAPFVVGMVPGNIPPYYRAMAEWALGRRPDLPPWAPAGGSQFLSFRQLTDAALGVLDGRGETGRAYLVGDLNLSFAQFAELFFEAAGNPQSIPSGTGKEEHPVLLDIMQPAGRGASIRYEPQGAETLGYALGDVPHAVAELVEAVRHGR